MIFSSSERLVNGFEAPSPDTRRVIRLTRALDNLISGGAQIKHRNDVA